MPDYTPEQMYEIIGFTRRAKYGAGMGQQVYQLAVQQVQTLGSTEPAAIATLCTLMEEVLAGTKGVEGIFGETTKNADGESWTDDLVASIDALNVAIADPLKVRDALNVTSMVWDGDLPFPGHADDAMKAKGERVKAFYDQAVAEAMQRRAMQ